MYGKRGVQAARLPLEPGGTGSKLSYRSQHAERSGERDRAGSSHTCLRRIAAGRKLGSFFRAIPPAFVTSQKYREEWHGSWYTVAMRLTLPEIPEAAAAPGKYFLLQESRAESIAWPQYTSCHAILPDIFEKLLRQILKRIEMVVSVPGHRGS